MSRISVPPSLRRLFVAAALVLAPLTSGAHDALAAVYNITYGANFAAASAGTATTTQQFTGAGSWSKVFPPAPKFETYIDVASQLGVSFKVNEIASLTFHTVNNATNPSNVDFFAQIYTMPFVGGDASWYGRRLTSETLYANGYVAPTAGVWNTWTTPAGPNQLTFFDSNHCGNAGFYAAPTLADLNAGSIDWATWPGNPTQGGSTGGPFDYGNQTVRLLSFQTGSGWASFEGQLDAITIALTNGDIYNIDLEATADDIFVDDDWVGLPAGTSVGPGKVIGVTAFATVQGGVNAALVGATVHVAAGSYTERVEIAKNITVRGAGKGVTIIHAPASIPTAFNTAGPTPNKPIVYVHDASDVKIEDLDVDGDGVGNANYRIIGVAYWRAGGRLLRVNVQEIRETPLSGTQHGVGIYANNDGGGPYALEVAECKVTDFQKNGMTLAGAGLTVNVHDCLVTGSGYTALIAQNGIQLSGGASGLITRCAISEMGYSPATVAASGVLVFAAGGSTTVSELNGANAITNVQSPINWYDSNGLMDGIEVSGGADFGPIFVYNSSVALAAGAPRLASGGPRPLASPSDGEIGSSARTRNQLNAAYTVSVLNSCLDGTDVAGTAGIGVYTEGGPLGVDARNNTISDWDAGLTSYGTAITLSARDNSITSNVSAGYDNTGNALAQIAEYNWWGDASGPSGDGGGTGDAVLGGNVDFTPFLPSGTDLVAGCGFSPAYRVRNLDTGLGYLAIQPAIGDPLTLNGHTIQADAGTYAENVTLNKDLTLIGAQAGNTACGRVVGAPDPATETIVTGPAPGATLLTLVTGSAGSTIDGFSFIGGTRGIESTSGPIHGVSVLNNHFAGFTGSAMFLNDAGTDVTVARNNMDGSSKTAPAAATLHLDTDTFDGFHLTDNCILNAPVGAGVFVDGAENVRPSAGRRPLIAGNRVENHSTNVGMNLGSRAFREGTISGNRIANNAFDGIQGGIRSSRITGNLFDNNGRWGLSLTSFGNVTAPRGAFSDTVTGNTFTANDSAGVFVSATMFAGHAGSNLINYNDIVGNGAGGAGDGAVYRGGETLQIGCNWWGDVNGPDYPPGNPNPPGDALFAPSAAYFPWLDGSITGTPSCNQFPPAPTTTALGSDNNPSDCGEKVNLTATVSPSTATGTVTFYDGPASIGSAPVVAGVATLSISSLGGGHHPLTATYGGDGDHFGSTSSQLIQNVHCATSSTVVEPTPCDSMGWSRANMRDGGFVEMTAAYPQSGDGSLELRTTNSVSKADWVRPNGNADLLSTLSALMVDLYRNSSSTSGAHLAPAVRLLVYNGQATNHTSYLIWEPVYNGVPSFPTDAWGSYDLFKGNFWQRAFKTTPPNVTIEIYNRTLADWLQPGTVTDGGGNVSNVVGPNARVIGYEIGVGSGWAGTFSGAADNFKIGFGATDSTFNFEPRIVTSTALAADMAKSFCGGKLTLTATVSPAGAEGVVEFADQAGAATYFEGFETGLGGDPGWDHGVSNFTAVRVASGTNGVTSATGAFHAEAVTANGSAFTRWGGYSSVFPPAGYTTMVKVYLDVAYASGAGDQRVDFSSAINNTSGAHRRDFVFNMGTEATGWVISAGNNSGRANSFPSNPGHDPVHITASGWYTLKHRFYNDGGVLACQMSLIDPSGAEIIGGPAWKRKDASDVISLIGGNRYGWFVNQELPFFAFDDASLTKATLGSAPVVGGVATLSVTTLPVGFHSFVATFVPSNCATVSSSDKLAHEVNAGSSSLVLAASPNPAKSGADLVTLTATVTPNIGTGTVEFFDGATSLGTAPVVGGVATLALKFADEGDHSLTATYSGDACLTGSSAAKVVLTVGGAPTVSIVDLSTTESNAGLKEFKFLVTLSSAVTQPVTVDFQVSDGTATLANNDYATTNGTVIIPAGSLTDTARVNVRGDTNREGDETFNVTLLNPTKATIDDGNAVGTIINDDGVPSILHTGVRVAEGHPNLNNIVVTVSLSNPSDQPVTVDWTTADSTATVANNDYIPASGQVTIPAKSLSASLVVQAVGDSINEDWEVFHVLLSNPVNATLGARPWLRVELSNDDTAPQAYIGDVTQLEGDAGTTAFTFRVWLNRGTVFGTPTVTYTTQNGTATTGNNDYQFQTGNITFGPKEREKFVTIFVNGDVNFEPNETFTVRLTNPRFGMGPIGDGTGVGTILNDDPKGCPEVTAFTPDPNLVVAGGIAKMSWAANGTDNPVTSIDLFISRDMGTSWEILSLGETNDGTYTWNPVTGPGTNGGINPEFTALFKVVAYDASACSTVAVSGPFAIYNTVTDVLVAQFQANPAGGGVEVRWELAAGLVAESVELERSTSLGGPWEVIAAERRQDGATVVALDRTASAGTTYYYRLSLGLQGGGVVRVGPLEVEAGSSIAMFALGKVSPNPSRGMTRVEFELPREASMRLSVVDVAGREVALLASGTKGAGRHQAVWSGETDRGRAPAGLYFIRFQAPGVSFVRRLVLTR